MRIRGAALAGACCAVLAVAWSLTPRAVGYGTHGQLGLPDCGVLADTGYPCPTCGMTTALSSMARGRIADAFAAHPFGVVLFAAVGAGAGLGLAEAATGCDLLRRLRPGAWWLCLAAGGLLAGWGLKLVAGILRGTLPTH